MGGIVEKAFYDVVCGGIILFVILPVAIIFVGHIIFIVIEVIKELWKK